MRQRGGYINTHTISKLPKLKSKVSKTPRHSAKTRRSAKSSQRSTVRRGRAAQPVSKKATTV